jgi:hypothetical protein
MQDHIIQLPISVTGRVDVGRLVRELEAIDNYLESESVRVPDMQPQLPKTSRLLEDIRLQNKLNILDTGTRRHLRDFLESVRTDAPMLHMSFSADPSPLFIQKLVTWLRQEIHPLVLLQVGLQPTIGAGTIVRTTNKQFDFSLRNRFAERREVLTSHMRYIGAAVKPTSPPAEIVAPVEGVSA